MLPAPAQGGNFYSKVTLKVCNYGILYGTTTLWYACNAICSKIWEYFTYILNRGSAMRKLLPFLIGSMLLLAGCSSKPAELNRHYQSQALNFRLDYTEDCTITEGAQGVEIALPSGKVVVAFQRIDNVVNFTEAQNYLGLEGKPIDVKLGELEGQSLSGSTGQGKERMTVQHQYGILEGKLYLLSVLEQGGAASGEKRLGQQIAQSFALADATKAEPKELESKALNMRIRYPGDCTAEGTPGGYRISLPGAAAGVELLSLPYEGDAEQIIATIKQAYVALAGKHGLQIELDENGWQNGGRMSLSFTQDDKPCKLELWFTAFNGRAYAIGSAGQTEALSRWQPTIEDILGSFAFIEGGEPVHQLAEIRERSIPGAIGSPLPAGQAVDDSFFADAVLLGDSLTYGFEAYQIDIPAKTIASTSISVGQVAGKEVIEAGSSTITMLEALRRANPSKVYLMLGVNSMGVSQENFIAAYRGLLGQIRQMLPEADIYVQSILPVTASKSSPAQNTSSYINNQRIAQFNKALLEMCWDEEVYYVDVGEAFRDENGCLPENLSADGVHIGPQSYRKWYEYLKSHTA